MTNVTQKKQTENVFSYFFYGDAQSQTKLRGRDCTKQISLTMECNLRNTRDMTRVLEPASSLFYEGRNGGGARNRPIR